MIIFFIPAPPHLRITHTNPYSVSGCLNQLSEQTVSIMAPDVNDGNQIQNPCLQNRFTFVSAEREATYIPRLFRNSRSGISDGVANGLEGYGSIASISRAKRWICDALVRLAGVEAYIHTLSSAWRDGARIDTFPSKPLAVLQLSAMRILLQSEDSRT